MGWSPIQCARSFRRGDDVRVTKGRPRVQVLSRRWKYGAPPWRLYEALVGEREGWLKTADDERTPALVDALVNERAVLAPWVHEETSDVEVLITTDGGEGSQLTVLVHAE